jgi:plasmid replication initiation protein
MQRVTKSNVLIKACYKMTKEEGNILLYGISLINPVSDFFPLSYKIDVKRFCTLFNLTSKGNYASIKQSVFRLADRKITLHTSEHERLRIHWLSSVIYNDYECSIEVRFHKNMMPYLNDFEAVESAVRGYTSYYLEDTKDFSSMHSAHIYELLTMHISKSKKKSIKVEIDLQEIREMLCITTEYPKFASFNDRVLTPVLKDINKMGALKVKAEFVRVRRAVKSIIFSIRKVSAGPEYIKHAPSDKVSSEAITKAHINIVNAQKGLDPRDIEKQFYAYVDKKGEKIRDLDRAYLGFVKKKIQVGA